MSASNRRAKRQIARLVRMDATRARMPHGSAIGMVFGMVPRSVRFWESCMVPLGTKLGRKGLRDRALEALHEARENRVRSGGRP